MRFPEQSGCLWLQTRCKNAQPRCQSAALQRGICSASCIKAKSPRLPGCHHLRALVYPVLENTGHHTAVSIVGFGLNQHLLPEHTLAQRVSRLQTAELANFRGIYAIDPDGNRLSTFSWAHVQRIPVDHVSHSTRPVAKFTERNLFGPRGMRGINVEKRQCDDETQGH